MNIDTYDLLNRLRSYPLFTLDAVCNINKKDASYTKVYLNRLLKKGMIRRIQRGQYTVHNDPIIFSTHITWPSYISLWYALRYHNLTEQVPEKISVLTTSKKSLNRIEFMGRSIVFTTIPSTYLFGYSKIFVSGFEVFMADPEKAIVDSIALRKISLSEIFSIIESEADRLSFRLIVDHVIRTGNVAAAKRIGWMLEKIGIDESRELEEVIYRTGIPLDYSISAKGKIDPKWGVMVNIGGFQ